MNFLRIRRSPSPSRSADLPPAIDWQARLATYPNGHDGDLTPWRTCPHCVGSGQSRLMVDGGYTCTGCSGSGFINRAGYWAAPPA